MLSNKLSFGADPELGPVSRHFPHRTIAWSRNVNYRQQQPFTRMYLPELHGPNT
jgi:hypothetical protein